MNWNEAYAHMLAGKHAKRVGASGEMIHRYHPTTKQFQMLINTVRDTNGGLYWIEVPINDMDKISMWEPCDQQVEALAGEASGAIYLKDLANAEPGSKAISQDGRLSIEVGNESLILSDGRSSITVPRKFIVDLCWL